MKYEMNEQMMIRKLENEWFVNEQKIMHLIEKRAKIIIIISIISIYRLNRKWLAWLIPQQ
jgi:hypothetical protein